MPKPKFMATDARVVRIGQIWERRDGSTFHIESRNATHAYFWQEDGPYRQYRGVRIDRFKDYFLVHDPPESEE